MLPFINSIRQNTWNITRELIQDRISRPKQDHRSQDQDQGRNPQDEDQDRNLQDQDQDRNLQDQDQDRNPQDQYQDRNQQDQDQDRSPETWCEKRHSICKWKMSHFAKELTTFQLENETHALVG